MIADNKNCFDVSKKSIVVLDGRKIHRLRLDEAVWLNKSNIYVLNIENIPEDFKKSTVYKKISRDLAVGSVFLQDPYDDDYIMIDETNVFNMFKNNALKRYTIFSHMCSILGAKKVRVENVFSSNETTNTNIEVSAKYKIVDTNVKVSSELLKDMKKALKLEDQYSGGAPDIQAAKTFVESKHLSNDIEFLTLIESRERNNKIISRQLTISLLSNTKKTLKIIGDIKIPAIFNISADIEAITKSKEEFFSNVYVEF
jgi:hypothetical protein